MSNYKLKNILANKITESSIGFNIQEEYGMRYELEKYEDQIKLEYGPQTFRDLQLKVQENREEEVAEWLKKNEFIKPETTEFHEGIVRNQIKSIIKKAINKEPVNEGKGQDLADKYVAQLRQEFKNLNDDELEEFRKTIAKAFDLKESVNEATIGKLEKDLEKLILKYMKDDKHDIPSIKQTVKLFPFSKFQKYYKHKKDLGLVGEGKVNEEDYPHSAPRVYVLMLGNRHRGTMGPYRVYVDRAAAEAEAAKQEAEGRDTKAFVQDLAFIK